MKKFFRYTVVILLVAAVAGYVFWQFNKKKLVKSGIEQAIKAKTDSLYFIHYDSSQIDEVNGNAAFYNITLQSDSVQKKMLAGTDSLPNALYNIRMSALKVSGVDIAGVIQKQHVAAKKIVLDKPVIQIINTGVDRLKPFTAADTMALYKRIVGQFSSISADTIQLLNGKVFITNKNGKALTTLENINISLNNFRIDSTRNYENIISYFIKDVKASVENIQLPESANENRINIENLEYDAPARTLHVKGIQQYELGNIIPVTDIKNIAVTQLNNDAFIHYRLLKANAISCDGGKITVYSKKKDSSAATAQSGINFSSPMIDQVQVSNIVIGNTDIILKSRTDSKAEPLTFNAVTFKASQIDAVQEGVSVSELLANANWSLTSKGFSHTTKDGKYVISATGVEANNQVGFVKVGVFKLKPILSEAAYMRKATYQQDRYDFVLNNITLNGVNFQKLLNDKTLEFDAGSLQPILRIFNDRTLPPGTDSKLGKYPHQAFVKLKFPVYARQLKVVNGSVYYKERAAKSEMVGIPSFLNLNGVLNNLTNIPGRIKVNPTLKINASAMFLGKAKMVTEWLLPLNDDSTFTISGNMSGMKATNLNAIIEPLAMAKVKKGQVEKLDFSFVGNNYGSKGELTFLYKDLNLQILKKGDDNDLERKGLISFIANAVIKNKNDGDKPRVGKIDFKRNIYKSFFNLLWKSVYDGVKSTVM